MEKIIGLAVLGLTAFIWRTRKPMKKRQHGKQKALKQSYKRSSGNFRRPGGEILPLPPQKKLNFKDFTLPPININNKDKELIEELHKDLGIDPEKMRYERKIRMERREIEKKQRREAIRQQFNKIYVEQTRS